MLFAFYLVMRTVISVVQAESQRDKMRTLVTDALNETKIPENGSSYLEKKYNLVSDPYFIESSMRANLYQNLNELMKKLSHEHIYFRGTLYDSNQNVIAKTGNALHLMDTINKTNEANNTDQIPVYKCLPLDKYMTTQEINDFFKTTHLQERQPVYLTGYDGDYIYPTKLELVKYANYQVKVINTKNFTPKNMDSYELVEFKSYDTDAYFERIGSAGEITPLMKGRYEYCDVVAKPAFDFWKNKGKGESVSKTFQANIFREEKGEVDGYLSGPTACYLSYGYVYYPLEETIHNLFSLYILGFLFVLILIMFLSAMLIKIYHKQQQMEQAKREMTSAVAHELKTPLAVIRGFSEGLKENINTDKKDYYLDVIMDETEQLDQMIHKLLNLSKLEANEYTLQAEELSLQTIAEDVVNRYRAWMEEKKITVTVSSVEDDFILADRFAMITVLSNFLSNAVKHTPTSKKITINIEQDGERLICSVENEGDNIPIDDMNKIWDSFYKVETARTRNGGTGGIGLTIAKYFLDLHHAKYGCANTEDGVEIWFSMKKPS